jgi:hypothetical protein
MDYIFKFLRDFHKFPEKRGGGITNRKLIKNNFFILLDKNLKKKKIF